MRNCLRDLRKARGLNQVELAEAIEVSRQTIIAMEADKYDPSLPMAYRLAAYFDVPVEELFFNSWRKVEGASPSSVPPVLRPAARSAHRRR
ncbi:MAG: helix-turn-helix transcriptional regulator [Sphingomonadaceae bacterium]|nr:helix-turn-helix transcriptional regulator [Sphingomonadaceae bacterium]MCP5391005.1 helix-turn-helix transcriptional regulator [Sphingomonadaceae bacterium]MCP5394690.1 helix-turn-helix transcriptional regulator [Sphingomonadaceae bacterium]